MSLKSGRDCDFQAKKGGMAGLRGKNGRESVIWEPYCGPSQIAMILVFDSEPECPVSIAPVRLVRCRISNSFEFQICLCL